MDVDICRGAVVRVSQNLLKDLWRHPRSAGAAGVGVPGGMGSLSSYPKLIQKRVVVTFPEIIRHTLAGVP
jgi:hypothetical protein